MWWFGRKGPSGFSARSTAEEVTRGIDGSGLTAIVTGASSGIGRETARIFALLGIHVVMGDINVEGGRKVEESILKEKPDAKINLMELDLSSMSSVRKFAEEFKSLGLPLNLLINNAGIMARPFRLSQDGIELQFATNYLGHFLLTNLLLETMKSTARESHKEGRIVNVSSIAHKFAYSGGIRLDRINEKSGYGAWSAYGQSKLASILHANELAKCFKKEGVDITSNSLHPGLVATNIARNRCFSVADLIAPVGKFAVKNVQRGAATTCYVALHPQLKGVSGEYFADSNIAKTSSLGKDENLANKLWDFSLSLAKSK